MYTNQTRKFLVQSSRRKQYQVVANNIDRYWTLIETTKRRTEGDLIVARRRIIWHMQERDIVLKHQVFDDEISKAHKEEILATGMTFQMTLQDDHRQTWKYQFIGVLSGTATTFSLHLWCQAIPQAECQLLLLQKSNAKPSISSCAYIYGPHYYNAEPFVPIGM